MGLAGRAWLHVLLHITCLFKLNFCKATSEIPRTCPISTTLFVRNRCYWSIGNGSFLESHRRCADQGGVLAEIPDQTVEKSVNKEFRMPMIWIGIHDMHEEGTYTNMFNTTVTYTHWAAGKPRGDAFEDCVMLTEKGWFEIDCLLKMVAMCSQKLQEPFEGRQSSTFQSKAPLSTTSRTKSSASLKTSSKKQNSTTLYASTKSESLQWTRPRFKTAQSTAFHSTMSKSTAPQSTTSRLLQNTAAFINKSTTRPSLAITQSTIPKLLIAHVTPLQPRSNSPFLHASSQVANQWDCPCPCGIMQKLVIIENEAQLKIKIEKMKKALRIDKAILSRSIRQRTSVLDSRPSVYIIGSSVGVVVVFVLAMIVFSDVRRLCSDVKHGRCRHCRR